MGLPPLYFAYGSNMNAAPMSSRCRDAQPIGIARLDDYRFRINRAGVATVAPEPGGLVFGRLWSIDGDDLGRLDRYEGINRGLYQCSPCAVESDGAQRQAQMYVATDSEPGLPRADYMTGVLDAARSLGLPDAYVKELASWE